MKSSTPLIKVVTEAMYLGAFDTQAVPEFKLILFLAKVDGTWTVGGRFPSLDDETLWRVNLPKRTFHRTMQRLAEARVVTIAKVGRSTIYALSQAFLVWCETLYEARNDRALVSQLVSANFGTQWVPTLAPHGANSGTPYIEDGKETGDETTAEAGPPGGGQVTDFPTDDGFYPDPKKRRRGSEGPVLGEDTTKPLAPTKAVRSAYPSSGPVARVREQFKEQFTAVSERRSVPLWGQAGKMHGNIRWLLERPDVTEDALVASFRFFDAMLPSLAFDRTSLWDEYFIRREELLHSVVVSSYGSRGGPRESTDDFAKRMAAKSLREMGIEDD